MTINYNKKDNITTISDVENFSLKDILDCGQSFRFKQQEDESFEGVVGNRLIKVKQNGTDLVFYNCDVDTYKSSIENYFALDIDYNNIKQILSQDETLKKTIEYAPGIRVMNQDLWETLCTFIISQNNNIKRITGIVDRFCSLYGTQLPGFDDLYMFPTCDQIACLTVEDMAPLRAGFRAKYLIDAAQKVQIGQVDLEKVISSDIEQGREILQKIYGVGPKVAECTLLFGAKKAEAFPIDVWMKRAMSELFPDGLPEYALQYAGIAQQYIFHYARMMKIK